MGTLPRLDPMRRTTRPFCRSPLLGQDFDTLNEQKSKPGKLVYDHGVTSGLKPSTGTRAGCWAGATSAEALTSAQLSVSVLPRSAVGHKFLLCFHR